MKFSRRSSHVKILKFSNFSGTQSVLREKQGDGSVVHITNALISGITPPPTILIILEGAVVILLHVTEDH